MKRLFLACMALFCLQMGKADNGFSIDGFTIPANCGELLVEIKMNNDVTFSGFQFDLELPEGVSIKEDGGYWVDPTERLKNGRKYHNVEVSLQSSGLFRIMVYSSSSQDIQGTSGEAVLEMYLTASDQVATGTFTPKISNIVMTQADETQYKPTDCSFNCTVTLSTMVTTLGYASFSWPKALDFTNSGLTAFIATGCNGQSIQLQEVTKVPANTGLILKGTAGSENSYPLETTDDASLDDVSSNQLTGTANGAYNVTGDNIYVLSNLDDGKPGFYNATEGIQVGQYKAYLAYTGDTPARMGLTFDEGETPTGIEACEQETGNGSLQFYDLQGRNVNQPQKGIYVSGGKKIIVK